MGFVFFLFLFFCVCVCVCDCLLYYLLGFWSLFSPRDMFQRLFAWIAARINQKISAGERGVKAVIGVLDIYGFEIFKTNSFEQASEFYSLIHPR